MKKERTYTMPDCEDKPSAADYFPTVDPMRKSSPQYKFGTQIQRATAHSTMSEYVPGPGQYPVLPKMGTEGRRNSMHGTLNYFPMQKE